MESTSIPGRIQISKSTRDLLLFRDAFNVEKRGLIEIKGKGHQETFFLNFAREENLFRTKSSRKSFNLLSEFIDLNDHDLADHDNFDSCSTGEPGSPNKHPLPPGQDGAQGGTQGGPGTKGFSDEEEADPKPTVLLVDDLLSILLQYTRVLQREGIHVVTAKNGLEGLDQLKRGKFIDQSTRKLSLIVTMFNGELSSGMMGEIRLDFTFQLGGHSFLRCDRLV